MATYEQRMRAILGLSDPDYLLTPEEHADKIASASDPFYWTKAQKEKEKEKEISSMILSPMTMIFSPDSSWCTKKEPEKVKPIVYREGMTLEEAGKELSEIDFLDFYQQKYILGPVPKEGVKVKIFSAPEELESVVDLPKSVVDPEMVSSIRSGILAVSNLSLQDQAGEALSPEDCLSRTENSSSPGPHLEGKSESFEECRVGDVVLDEFLSTMVRILGDLGKRREADFLVQNAPVEIRKRYYGDDLECIVELLYPEVPPGSLEFDLLDQSEYEATWIKFLTKYQLVGRRWKERIGGLKTKGGVIFNPTQTNECIEREQSIFREELDRLIAIDQEIANICDGTMIMFEGEASECTHVACAHVRRVSLYNGDDRRSFVLSMSSLSASIRARFSRQYFEKLGHDYIQEIATSVMTDFANMVMDFNTLSGLSILFGPYNVSFPRALCDHKNCSCTLSIDVGPISYPIRVSFLKEDMLKQIGAMIEDNPCTPESLTNIICNLTVLQGKNLVGGIHVCVEGHPPLLGSQEAFEGIPFGTEADGRLIIAWNEKKGEVVSGFRTRIRIGDSLFKMVDLASGPSYDALKKEAKNIVRDQISFVASLIARNRTKGLISNSESPWTNRESKDRRIELESVLKRYPGKNIFQMTRALEKEYKTKGDKEWFLFWERFQETVRFFFPGETFN